MIVAKLPLPETNGRWFDNLLTASLEARVRRVILISFPHVEGPTTIAAPATGRLDREPVSVHARTRLEEERSLFRRTPGTGTTPVVLRLGMVYGRGILMVDAARWLAVRRLLAVWREPTWIQLVSTLDWALMESWKDAGIPVEAVNRKLIRPSLNEIKEQIAPPRRAPADRA